jgi:hypothetical protein
MNRFLRPISASIDALCNVKHRTNLGYKREKNPSIYKLTFKVSMRQISSVNKFGENDRDSLYDRFDIGISCTHLCIFNYKVGCRRKRAE